MMMMRNRLVPLATLFVTAWSINPCWAATEALRLLPADSDVIVTINVRDILHDHRDTKLAQRYLEQWRLALKGDEKALKKYHQAEELRKFEGITEREFLDRAATIKKVCDSFGVDPLSDIERVTIAAQARQGGFVAVIVEGKFPQAKAGAALKGLRPAVRQVLGAEADAAAASGMLLFADSKKTLTTLEARLGKKDCLLPKGVVALAESGAKEHIAVVFNHADDHLKTIARFLKEDVAAAMGSDEAATKFAITQAADWMRKNADDYTSAFIAMSPRENGVRLQLGLDTKKPERARELRSVASNWGILGGLGLRAVNDDVAKQFGEILMRQRVVGEDTTVIVHSEIPGKFIQLLWQRAMEGLDASKSPVPAFLATQVTGIPLWNTSVPKDEIVITRGIEYRTGPRTDSFRHRLDMYLPKDKKDFPVVVMVHGGAWTIGDNRSAGLYPSVAQFLASQGIGVVAPNYRLAPGAKHPEHVKDVARAVAWTKANLGKHGGDLNRLFLLGHSAGAHLVSLVATDDSYLRAEEMKHTDIKGVLAFSGVYRIPDGPTFGSLGGGGPLALRLEQMLPVRGDSSAPQTFHPPGIPFTLDVFTPVFGEDAKVRAQASPITHVRRGLPPFRIFVAEHDLPTLATDAEAFDAALRKAGCDVKLLRMSKRNHNSLMFSAIAKDDPAARAVLEFIGK